MNVREAIFKRRSVRKFTEEKVSEKELLNMIDCARVAAYGANMQPLKFRMVTDAEETAAVFETVKWAGYLEDGAPKEGERPTAYIAVMGDMSIRRNGAFETDAGAAVTNMMLAAVEMGLATCWLGAIDRAALAKIFKAPDNMKVLYLLAVGHAAEESRMTDIKDGSVKYYYSEDGVLNVPKRALEDIIIR